MLHFPLDEYFVRIRVLENTYMYMIQAYYSDNETFLSTNDNNAQNFADLIILGLQLCRKFSALTQLTISSSLTKGIKS